MGRWQRVITFVTGRISPDRMQALGAAYHASMRPGLPPAIEDTSLVIRADDRVGILTLWRSRADLDAILASGKEPPARRLLGTHGGEAEATF